MATPLTLPLAYPSFASLDEATIAQNFELLTDLVQEANPSVDVRRGVFHDLLLGLSAVLAAAGQTIAQQIIDSGSLLAITENPTLATDDIVNALMSNFRLTRRAGTNAFGPVQIILSSPVVITLPKDFVFTANGMNFVTDTSYTSRLSSSAVLTSTDRLITPVGDGTYSFTITLVAADTGTAGNVKRGVRMTPSTVPSQNFIQAVVVSSFTGGADTETNAQMLTRLASSIAAKAWSNRFNIDAMIREQTLFEGILGTSIIGFGDDEMLRDQHTLWPGSMGGRADVYVRTQERVSSTVLSKPATLVQKTTDGGIWQFSLSRDEVPGFYDVDKIAQAGQINAAESGYGIADEIRQFDLSDAGDNVPDITTAEEAAFSPYQTTTIRFLDTDTPTSDLAVNAATRTYDVSVRSLSLLSDIQEFIKQRSVIGPSGDVLVRAPIPCDTSIELAIDVKPGTNAVDTESMQNAIASAVNNLSFGTRLSAAVVTSAITALLPVGALISSLNMTGVVRHPDNTTETLHASDVLAAPTTNVMTTQRTMAYFTDPDAIVITVTTVDSPQV